MTIIPFWLEDERATCRVWKKLEKSINKGKVGKK